VLSAAATLPHFVVVTIAPFVSQYSLYTVVQGLFMAKLALATAAFVTIGAESAPASIAIFLMLNKVCNEAMCRHGNLVVADLVDEDYSINKRQESASTILYGANALFTKPGQSIAPMLGWSVLQYVGYDADGNNAVRSSDSLTLDSSTRGSMFNLLVFLPATCALVQLFLWNKFSLRGSYLQLVKEHRKKHCEV